MQSLSKLAALVVLLVILFALFTQRILISHDSASISPDQLIKLLSSSGEGEKLPPRHRSKAANIENKQHKSLDSSKDNQIAEVVQNLAEALPTSEKYEIIADTVKPKQEIIKHGDKVIVKGVPYDQAMQIMRQQLRASPAQKPNSGSNTGKITPTTHPTAHNKAHNTDNSKSDHHHKKTSKKKHPIRRLHEPTRHNYHPNISPRVGTDISPQHETTILRCVNQTKCIVPDLQLKVKLKVYLCKKPVRSGARFYYLMSEGLLNHPGVELLPFSDIESADLVVYLPASAPWHLTECTNSSLAKKLIVLDEFDGHSMYLPYNTVEEAIKVYGKELDWYLMLFKRSYVTRLNGVFMNYPHIQRKDFYPLVYSLAEMYMSDVFVMQREIDIVCTLRGHKGMRTRQRAQDWVQEYRNRSIEIGKPLNIIAGQADTGTRVDVSKTYFENMYNTKIIVTVNPSEWEGDFRLWESMASGALVFCDPVFVPHEYPLIHGKHIVYFDNLNRDDLFSKLDYYLSHPQEARRIAVSGYLFAMKHHRTVSMVDYILRSTHVKLSALHPEKYGTLTPSSYMYTAQYLLKQTLKQARQIKINNYPGNYTTGF